jgi:hypothetical protein
VLKGSKTREEEEPRERAKGKKTKVKERREKLRKRPLFVYIPQSLFLVLLTSLFFYSV